MTKQLYKMSYAEQLQHPNWQKKRLEALDASGFECSNCGDKESMLHVHHRQYIKGRKAWEYDISELAVLCAKCHKAEHDVLDEFRALLSVFNTQEIYSLCAGFHHTSDLVESGTFDSARKSNAMVYAAGFVARMLSELEIWEIDEVGKFASTLADKNSEVRLQYEHVDPSVFGRESL